MSDKYTTIYVTVPISDKAAIKACAKTNGETLNELYARRYMSAWTI